MKTYASYGTSRPLDFYFTSLKEAHFNPNDVKKRTKFLCKIFKNFMF